MNIAVVCYHTLGGSGIIAYELGSRMAEMGHTIHFIGKKAPFRMTDIQENVTAHTVDVMDYNVFSYPPYTLSLSSRICEIVENCDIDIVHCHYAVPHAIAGILARDMSSRDVKVVTTLHGTDITLVGSHPSFFNITKYAIEKSDAVTAVSDHLKKRTERVFDIQPGVVRRIYNFIDSRPPDHDACCECLEKKGCGKHIIVHASNMRNVKQPMDLIAIFEKVHHALNGNCELWMIGEGPLRPDLERSVKEKGLSDAVQFFGVTYTPEKFFMCADLFLLTSREESFGLAALEAMVCRTAVVAYSIGGLPEVVEDGHSGRLLDFEDIDGMARACTELLTNRENLEKIKANAYQAAVNRFPRDKIINSYLNLYKELLTGLPSNIDST